MSIQEVDGEALRPIVPAPNHSSPYPSPDHFANGTSPDPASDHSANDSHPNRTSLSPATNVTSPDLTPDHSAPDPDHSTNDSPPLDPASHESSPDPAAHGSPLTRSKVFSSRHRCYRSSLLSLLQPSTAQIVDREAL